MGQQFDELAKAFAEGQSRRRALRRFVAGLAGGVVGLLVPGAAKPAHSLSGPEACVRFCLTLRGQQRARCFALAPTCTNGCGFSRVGIICL